MAEREEIIESLRESERQIGQTARLIWERYKPTTMTNIQRVITIKRLLFLIATLIVIIVLRPAEEAKFDAPVSIFLGMIMLMYFFILSLPNSLDENQTTGNNTEVNDNGLTPEQVRQKYNFMTEDELVSSIKYFAENNDDIWNADRKFLATMPSLDLMPIEYLYAFIYGLMKVIELRLNARLEKTSDLEETGSYSVIRNTQASAEFELLDRDLCTQLENILDQFHEQQQRTRGKTSKRSNNKSLLFQVLNVLKKHKLKQKVVLQRSMANGQLVLDTASVIKPACFSHSPEEASDRSKSLHPWVKSDFPNPTQETNRTDRKKDVIKDLNSSCILCEDVGKLTSVEMYEVQFVRQKMKYFNELIEGLFE